jgi:23S rRNA-/tRNA-specific pseudouridylate synthase
MHQIRVHLSWYGFPIVGDRIYGPRRQTMLPDRIFLHLSMMELRHPVTEESIKIGSELPPELNSILTFMRRPKWS